MGRLPNGELPLAAQLSFVQEIEQIDKEIGRAPVKHHKDLRYLLESDPKGYKDIIERLSLGQSVAKITRETGFQPAIIRSVVKVHPQAIESRRESIIDLLEESIHSVAEKISEGVDDLSINRAAELLKETVKNYQLLRGEVTSRSETRSVASPEDLQKMFDALPKAKVIDNDILSDK